LVAKQDRGEPPIANLEEIISAGAAPLWELPAHQTLLAVEILRLAEYLEELPGERFRIHPDRASFAEPGATIASSPREARRERPDMAALHRFVKATVGKRTATSAPPPQLSPQMSALAAALSKPDLQTYARNVMKARDEQERVETQAALASRKENNVSKKVFLVHGHDNEAKHAAEAHLLRLGLDPIILHEQPNGGKTIIEKFEANAERVTYAVVLLTPDDVGASKVDHAKGAPLRARARQNVVAELFYFVGKLGRASVCALVKGDVEIPSDFSGVVYLAMDEAGAWKTKLEEELIHANVPVVRR
jgi:predicted nucleotide-binding protein